MKLALEKIDNWIFVSGAIRSGTTFTGRVLSLPLEVDYIHEPYNQLRFQSGESDIRPYMRLAMDTERMRSYHEFSKRLFKYDIDLPNYVPKSDPFLKQISKRFIGSRGPFYLTLAKLNIFHRAAVIKDPTALFLTEYLYKYFHVKPVILIKHPISFVVSVVKRKKWLKSPSELSHQSDLIKDYFSDEPGYFDKNWDSPIKSASAYWRILYKVLLSQSSNYPDWHIVKHEEMSQDPVSFFNHLYNSLDLNWSDSIEKKVISMTKGAGKNQVTSGKVHSLRRDSSKIFQASIDSLSKDERREIFDVVQDVALKVYPRSSFAID